MIFCLQTNRVKRRLSARRIDVTLAQLKIKSEASKVTDSETDLYLQSQDSRVEPRIESRFETQIMRETMRYNRSLWNLWN